MNRFQSAMKHRAYKGGIQAKLSHAGDAGRVGSCVAWEMRTVVLGLALCEGDI